MTDDQFLIDLSILSNLDNASVSAVKFIVAERLRQIQEEGWSVVHDDNRPSGQLAEAASCYATALPTSVFPTIFWPWSDNWWKPKSIMSNRVRAGALLVAEIARSYRTGE